MLHEKGCRGEGYVFSYVRTDVMIVGMLHHICYMRRAGGGRGYVSSYGRTSVMIVGMLHRICYMRRAAGGRGMSSHMYGQV